MSTLHMVGCPLVGALTVSTLQIVWYCQLLGSKLADHSLAQLCHTQPASDGHIQNDTEVINCDLTEYQVTPCFRNQNVLTTTQHTPSYN